MLHHCATFALGNNHPLHVGNSLTYLSVWLCTERTQPCQTPWESQTEDSENKNLR